MKFGSMIQMSTLTMWRYWLYKDLCEIKNLFSFLYRKIQFIIELWAKDLSRHFNKEGQQVENKYMKICSASFIIGELWIKTMRLPLYACSNDKNPKHRKQKLRKIWNNSILHSLLVGKHNDTTALGTTVQFLTVLNIGLPMA